ncbi:MAG TPA: DUF4255 domain-containing protein [Fluviicola sp.]|nr:DUF4255 domain-containing protein [Fluviicola sp.]
MQILTDEVNNYFTSQSMGTPVSMNNIAMIEHDATDDNINFQDSVLMTLLNMNEEKTLKNFPNVKHENNRVVYQNNRINLNLFVLFSANRNTYARSLKDISKIVEFFQGKRLFTQANSDYNRSNVAMAGVQDFHFTVELYTPSFEELNFIWGALGGKQYPSALYKLSLIEIVRDVNITSSSRIGGVGIGTNTPE